MSCTIEKSTDKDVEKLDWLMGNWNRIRVKEGRSAFERWEKITNHELIGLGVYMNGLDTVFTEKLRIIVKDGDLYYVADVIENPEPVYFKFTQLTSNGFVCENPDHDFPKKIEYAMKGDTLIATTSGDDNELIFEFLKTGQ